MIKIKLTKNQFTIISNKDHKRVSKYKWFCSKQRKCFYARRTNYPDKKVIYLHRFIMRVLNKKIQIDHKDGNGLNNTRKNLRLCTSGQNAMNKSITLGISKTSKFKGVQLNLRNMRWISVINFNRKLIHLGTFDSQKEAAIKYDKSAVKYFGKFAKTNKMMGLL